MHDLLCIYVYIIVVLCRIYNYNGVSISSFYGKGMYISVHVYVIVCLCVYVCVCSHVYLCLTACMCTFMCVYMYVCNFDKQPNNGMHII